MKFYFSGGAVVCGVGTGAAYTRGENLGVTYDVFTSGDSGAVLQRSHVVWAAGEDTHA